MGVVDDSAVGASENSVLSGMTGSSSVLELHG